MLSAVLWAGGVGLAASVALVGAAQHWARRQTVLDHPNDRSLHVRPTPRGGGIGVVIPVCCAIAAVGVLEPGAGTPAICLAGTGLAIAAVGLTDDVRGLPALMRLVAHLSAAILVVIGIGTWRSFVWPGLHSMDLTWAAVPLTVFVIIGLTNAYNFMDGVDGIAGVQGIVAGLGWVAAGYALQDSLLAVVGAVIAMASVGFLLFNWSPASVFMGDVGSSFLGFLLAALTIYASVRSPAMGAAGILFVWPFVFDTTFTMLRRAGRRENLLSAHRSHLYQRLVLTGVSHAAVALLYGALAAVGLVVGIAVTRGIRTASTGGAILIAALAAGLWLAVIRRERRHTRRTCEV